MALGTRGLLLAMRPIWRLMAVTGDGAVYRVPPAAPAASRLVGTLTSTHAQWPSSPFVHSVAYNPSDERAYFAHRSGGLNNAASLWSFNPRDDTLAVQYEMALPANQILGPAIVFVAGRLFMFATFSGLSGVELVVRRWPTDRTQAPTGPVNTLATSLGSGLRGAMTDGTGLWAVGDSAVWAVDTSALTATEVSGTYPSGQSQGAASWGGGYYMAAGGLQRASAVAGPYTKVGDLPAGANALTGFRAA